VGLIRGITAASSYKTWFRSAKIAGGYLTGRKRRRAFFLPDCRKHSWLLLLEIVSGNACFRQVMAATCKFKLDNYLTHRSAMGERYRQFAHCPQLQSTDDIMHIKRSTGNIVPLQISDLPYNEPIKRDSHSIYPVFHFFFLQV